jgi:hypothetical protein
MCQHETRLCSRCQQPFECKVGNILECQCYGVSMSDEEKKFIADNYSDCLCHRCLEDIKTEFRQKAMDRKLNRMISFSKGR